MTDWTPKDTARLRGHFGLREDVLQDTLDDADFVGRAAAHIEALEARVAELGRFVDNVAGALEYILEEKLPAPLDQLFARVVWAIANGDEVAECRARIAELESERAEVARVVCEWPGEGER